MLQLPLGPSSFLVGDPSSKAEIQKSSKVLPFSFAAFSVPPARDPALQNPLTRGRILYPSRSVHTGVSSPNTSTRIDVTRKQFSQFCSFYSVHRVSAHDTAFVYGIAYVACYFSLPEILHRYETLSHAVLCNSKKATSSYVDCLPAMAQSFRKPSRATCLVHNALIGILIQQDTTHPEKYVQSVRMYKGAST